MRDGWDGVHGCVRLFGGWGSKRWAKKGQAAHLGMEPLGPAARSAASTHRRSARPPASLSAASLRPSVRPLLVMPTARMPGSWLSCPVSSTRSADGAQACVQVCVQVYTRVQAREGEAARQGRSLGARAGVRGERRATSGDSRRGSALKPTWPQRRLPTRQPDLVHAPGHKQARLQANSTVAGAAAA